MNRPTPRRRRRSRDGTAATAPTASIRIIGSHVAVNGRSLHVDDGDNLHAAAIAEVARSAAGPLGQPVRTVATADGATSVLLVHPDGSAEVLDEGQDPALAAAHMAARPAQPRRARRRPTRLHAGVASGLVAAAAVAVVSVFTLGRDVAADEATDGNEGTRVAAVGSSTLAPTTRPTTPPATSGPIAAPPARALRVRAQAGGNDTLVLRIRVSDRPTRLTVRATPTSSATTGRDGSRQPRTVRERSIRATKGAREVRLVLRDLAPGLWRWTVSTPRAEDVRGRIRVPDRPATSEPTTPPAPETSAPTPTYPEQQPVPAQPSQPPGQQPSQQPSQQPTRPPPVPVDPNQDPVPAG